MSYISFMETGRATVKRLSAMPRQGVSSVFTSRVGFGSILGVVQALHVSPSS